MPRALAPCGTAAAYRRHKRRGEPVDDACAAAAREQKNSRVLTSRDRLAEVTRLNVAERRASEQSAAQIDPVAEARWALQLVKSRMEAGGSDITSLARTHSELVAEIARLERAASQTEKVSALDQLAQRRADRLAASAD